MSFIKDLYDDFRDLSNLPGSPEAIYRAFKRNSWGLGGGVTGETNTHTSWDDIFGGQLAESAGARRVGRGVGLAFAGYGAGAALGAGAGATEVGVGLPLAEEAGAGMGTGLAEAGVAGEVGADSVIGDQALTGGVENAPEALIQGEVPEQVGIDQPLAAEAGSKAPPAEKGLIGKAMDWVNAKPVNAMIAYKGVEGVAQGALANRAENRKRKADQETREYNATIQQRLKQGNPSVGGRGVNVNLAPGNRVLLRPDGTPVYLPGGGLINSRMNGVRG
jgi:hypothetical protein